MLHEQWLTQNGDILNAYETIRIHMRLPLRTHHLFACEVLNRGVLATSPNFRKQLKVCGDVELLLESTCSNMHQVNINYMLVTVSFHSVQYKYDDHRYTFSFLIDTDSTINDVADGNSQRIISNPLW